MCFLFEKGPEAYVSFANDDTVGSSGRECNKVGGTGMLVGTYEHKIDSKARIVLPSKFREELGESVFATIGIDKCVSLYSPEEWRKMMERLQELSFSKSKSRGLLRLMLSSAHELPLDGAGRILLPPVLREYAEFFQEVVFVGVSDHVEMWDKEKWNDYRKQVLDDLPEIAEGVEGF